MATLHLPGIPDDAAPQRSWPRRDRLSRWADRCEAFLTHSSTDRGPWLTIALAAGIGLWFLLPASGNWIAAIGGLVLAALGALAMWRGREDRQALLLAGVTLPLVCAAGIALIWLRSETVGTPAIAHPMVRTIDARVLEREEQPSEDRVRLTLAFRDAETAHAMKVRVNVPLAKDVPELTEGARIRLRARLMPPSPPMLPGAYDFARAAWFSGLGATGTVLGDIELVERPAPDSAFLARVQRSLAAHVRANVNGSAGAIAAAFASGDRGAIDEADDDAMRDAGLTHLLSISGLHVSAVVAACYFLTLKLLAAWGWLALRFRLPLIAAAAGAGAGIGYTLLTGSEVPTVRSCLAALLVLGAMAIGRDALSLRMIAVAAAIVLLLWPESLIGPSFQMSFAAVTAIVALHGSAPMRALLAPRAEPWWHRAGRNMAALFLTGVAIEIVLTPVVLFHFHRAGLYGALANVVAIPLVTFCAMPLIALALLLDLIGMGAPVWWLVEQSLELLLGIAHFTSAQPGSVKLFPQMGMGTVMLFVGGSLWLALWRGRVRLAGLLPVALGTGLLAATPAPDVLVSGDGRHVGIAGEGDRLLVLRSSRSSYASDHLLELSGMEGDVVELADWPGARCSRDFCTITLARAERSWRLLLARSNAMIEQRQLAAACERVDIVIATRRLPRSCRPAWLKADRRYLEESGGLALYLDEERVDSVSARQGQHGWWQTPDG